MDITTKELEYCKLAVSCVANVEEISSKKEEVLRLFQKAPVPGFRKGKTGMDAIKMHYRTQIEDSLKRAMAEDAYHNTLFEKKLRPYGAPQFNSLILEKNKFTCDFDIFVKPDFELSEYKGFEIPKPHEPTSSQEIAQMMLQELRQRYGTSYPYTENDFVQNGDSVILDYTGTINGEKLDSLCAQGEMVTIGNSKLANFDDNLLGMIIGNTREFDVVVPDDGLPSFAGKMVHFIVTLKMGAKQVPCPLNDELAVKLNKKSIDELKELVYQTAMARYSEACKMAFNEAVSRKILEGHNFVVPNWMSLSEAKFIAQQSKLDWEKLEDVDKEKYIEIAGQNVRLALVLDKIRDVEPEAQLSDQETLEDIKRNIIASKTQASVEDVLKQMASNGYLQVLSSRIKDQYTLDFVGKTIKIIE
jgi:trigger factor